MNDPWQILILDCNTATEKDVKAAYARLLKQHRPDSDPEGFRRVRDAYETAMAMVRERDVRGTPPPAYVQEPAGLHETGSETAEAPVFASPSFTLPEAVLGFVAEMERAAASGNAEQLEAALEAFHQKCDSAHVDGAARAGAMEQACGGRVKVLAAAVSNAVLLRLAEMGQVYLPELVVSAWVEEKQSEKIVQFGRAMLDQSRALATPEGALLMARVGVIVGLERPGLASSLGNLAYPHLPVDSRAHIMQQLEHESALGRAFEDVTPEMRPFWFERLRHAQEPHDWQDVPSLRALSDLINRSRYMWQGWGIVQQLMPPEQWAPVENRLRQQAHQVTQSTPRASKPPVWLVTVAIIAVLNLLRFMGSNSSSPEYPTSARPRPSIDPFQTMRIREELTRKGLLPSNDTQGLIQGAQDAGNKAIDLQKLLMATELPPIKSAPLLNSPSPAPLPGSEPSPAGSPSDEQKAREAYLRNLQNGTLFDGTKQRIPAP